MPQPFFATIKPAGYEQYPDLMIVTPLQDFGPGSPPPRPHPSPEPPRPSHPIALPGDPWWGQDLHPSHPIALPGDPWWGQDLRPTHPIVLPPDAPIPPGWISQLPGPGEPGSPSNPYPPGSVPPHPATGLNTFYMVIPYVGVVGPFTMPPGVDRTPPVPETPPA